MSPPGVSTRRRDAPARAAAAMAAGGGDAATAADIAGCMGSLRIDETPTLGSRISVRLECPYIQKVSRTILEVLTEQGVSWGL